ncbi:LPXTG-motif cell wall-anchored protein [Streptosporangium brasiliense]|uniref:LPXTG-motif cell wall-anchored protein n=1 Tax=Streptosporangium brasiliense TaxID=47480 RepID=A0ABT9RNK3_9ACTN|nr:LPXTG-motif cell wall-anchored protein [Streptosporangium brasiliense]
MAAHRRPATGAEKGLLLIFIGLTMLAAGLLVIALNGLFA